MTNITQMLERLAQAKSTSQFRQIMAGYATKYRKDYEATRALYYLQEIGRFNGRGRKRNGSEYYGKKKKT